MRKQLKIVIACLLSAFIMDQGGNDLLAQATAGNVNSVAERDITYTKMPSLFSPKEVGMNPEKLTRIDAIVKLGIEAKAFPGCQVLVMKEGKLVYDKCFGNYTYESAQKVQPTTMYDLASLSKTTGTLLAIMKLYDKDKLKLTDKASKYLTFLRGTDKESITIKELLFHESGLPAGLPFYELPIANKDTSHAVRMGSAVFKFKEDWVSKTPSKDYTLQVSDSFYLSNHFHDAAMQLIAKAPLRSKTYLYSCVNFILLKEIAETISGLSMNAYLEKEYYASMRLSNLAYLPLRTHKKEEIAPTLRMDFLRGGVLQGYVHDPDAAIFGGVSGNAGLFASAWDVAIVYQMLLNGGELDGKRYLSAETCKLFTTTTSASGRRGLGYDKPVPSNPKRSPCCQSAPFAVFGHTGYTGTCCWADPVNDMVYVFLSNRTYPNDGVNKLSRMGIRSKIQEVIYQSMK